MVVIGGAKSSNTRKLYEICKKECPKTYLIQTFANLDLSELVKEDSIGITAGPVPRTTLSRRLYLMSEQSFGELLAEEGGFKAIHQGDVVEGTVILVKENQIILNIGYKSDGVITKNEYTQDATADLQQLVNVGDTIKAKVIKTNDGEGQVALSYRRMLAEQGDPVLQEAFENKTVLTAKVSQVMNGGLSVMVGQSRVFIPASLCSDTYVKDLFCVPG